MKFISILLIALLLMPSIAQSQQTRTSAPQGPSFADVAKDVAIGESLDVLAPGLGLGKDIAFGLGEVVGDYIDPNASEFAVADAAMRTAFSLAMGLVALGLAPIFVSTLPALIIASAVAGGTSFALSMMETYAAEFEAAVIANRAAGYADGGTSAMIYVDNRNPLMKEIMRAEQYGDIPGNGGNSLSTGLGGGITFLLKKGASVADVVVYDHKLNIFTIDNKSVYVPPLKSAMVKELISHFSVNTRLGITIGSGGVTPLIYDKKLMIDKNGPVATNMLAADLMMGQIVRGGTAWMNVFKTKGGFKPKRDDDRKTKETNNTIFSNVGFNQEENIIRSKGRSIRMIIAPTRRDKLAAKQGTLVDYERLDGFLAHYEEHPFYGNMQHLLSNLDYYTKEPSIRRMFDIAEVIGFLGTYYYSAKNHQTQNGNP